MTDARLARSACPLLQHSLRPSVSPRQESFLRTPRFLAVLLLALTALVLGACGGSDEEDGGGAASDDVNTLLEQTFTGEKQVDSGNLAVNFTLEAQGEGAEELQGP